MEQTQTSGKKIYAQILVGSIIILGMVSYIWNWMPLYMGLFFLLVSGLKFLDLKWFSRAYSKYDIVGKKFPLYARLYPFIELGLWVWFLSGINLKLAWLTTGIIMITWSIGVVQNILSPNRVKCACLGTKLDIPLTHLTLVEDILMALMWLIMFLGL